LLSTYFNRSDLQNAYPEVKDGNFLNLIKWAINVCDGQIKREDNASKILSKFQPWYNEYWSNYQSSKELPNKIEQINQLEKNIVEKEVFVKEAQTKLVFVKEAQTKLNDNSRKIVELEKNKDSNSRKIVELEKNKDSNSRKIVELEKIKDSNSRKIEQFQDENNSIQNELRAIQASVSFRIVNDLALSIGKKMPPYTKRGKLLKKIINNWYKKRYHVSPELPKFDYSNQYLFDDYVDNNEFESIQNSFQFRPKISIITPVYNTNITFLKKAIQSVKDQYYTNWQLCICDDNSTNPEIKGILDKESSKDDRIKVVFSTKNEGISLASNKALQLADGDYTLLFDHDDELAKNALLEIVKILNNDKELDYIYSDEDKINEEGQHVEPFFKPDWSPDLFLSCNYPIHVSVFRTSLLKEIGGFRKGFKGSQDYDLILRYTEKIKKIAHIPQVLYSWRKSSGSTALKLTEKDYAYESGTKALQNAMKRRGIDGECMKGLHEGTYRIKYNITENPLVSIIVPTKTLKNLEVCVDSVLKKSTYRNFEIIVVDNSQKKEIEKFCNRIKEIKHVPVEMKLFNFSKVNNIGVEKSDGKYIIFLNDDTEVISPDWIECLLEHAQRDEVGVVGAKLLYHNELVQHAGTIIGINGHADNYRRLHRDDPGYFAFAKMIRNCGAVTAACMMVKKNIFKKLGGYDEKLGNSWQDVDLCLRASEQNKYVVYTPYSLLYHYEGKTRGGDDASKEELEARKIFRNMHREIINQGDPFYNQNLSLKIPFAVVRNYKKPVKILSDLFERREDLQQTFPDDPQTGFKNMITWAATHGIIVDADRVLLGKNYDYYYNHCSKESKPFAEKIRFYLNNKEIQEKFPEVSKGVYEHFLKFMESKSIKI